MPDTSRTVAELKSIFADNSSGDISAQDMRDFVESVPAGLIANTTSVPVSYWVGTGGEVGTTQTTIPFGSSNVKDDPLGITGVGTYSSPDWWGEDFSEGSWLSLPTGLWHVFFQAQGSGTDGADFEAYLGCVDNSMNDGLDNFLAYVDIAAQGRIGWMNEANTMTASGIFRVLPTSSPLAFAWIGRKIGTTDFLNITFNWRVVTRLG